MKPVVRAAPDHSTLEAGHELSRSEGEEAGGIPGGIVPYHCKRIVMVAEFEPGDDDAFEVVHEFGETVWPDTPLADGLCA